MDGTGLDTVFFGIFVGALGCVDRCVPISMVCLRFFVGGNV